MKWWVILLIVPAALACVVPKDGMLIDYSMRLCSDVYYFDKGITVSGNDITLDCDGAVFKSWNGGKGVSVEHSSNVSVNGCRVVSYQVGMYVRNSTEVFLNDNHLVRNQIGTRFAVVSDSATFNHDVSLVKPFDILESENNALSLTNKPVEGDFCAVNFCNEQRSAVVLFAQPQTPAPEMGDWLLSQLTDDNPKKLYDWVFGPLLAGWNVFHVQ